MQVEYSKQAKKYLQKLDKSNREKIEKAIEDLKDSKGDIIKMEHLGIFRLKLPPFRIGFDYDRKTKTIEIILIRPRGDFYKHLRG